MMNIFLFIQIILGILLVATILIQKTNVDGLSGIGGANIISAKTTKNFLTKTTITLAAFFMLNSIILANLSITRYENKVFQKLEEQGNIPMAK